MAQKLGNARLAIPKVNRNPRIAQHQPVPARRAIANHTAIATAPRTMATTPAQPSNTVPATQTTPVDPMANAPAATAAPNAGGTPDLFPLPKIDPNDPRDPTYWANVGKLQFSAQQEYSKGLREQTRADTDYGDALQTAIRNRAVQQRSLGEDAIRGNLGASGWLDRNEGEQTAVYTQDRAHAARNKEEEDQARAAAQAAIREGFGLDLGTELAGYGDRYAQRKREEAQNTPPEVGGATPSGSAGPAPGSYTGTGSAHAFGHGIANAPHPGGQNAHAIADLIKKGKKKK